MGGCGLCVHQRWKQVGMYIHAYNPSLSLLVCSVWFYSQRGINRKKSFTLTRESCLASRPLIALVTLTRRIVVF